jgi:hypothetical protein
VAARSAPVSVVLEVVIALKVAPAAFPEGVAGTLACEHHRRALHGCGGGTRGECGSR